MTGKGAITTSPRKRIRLQAVLYVLWLGTVLALTVWWGALLMKQARQIDELQSKLGAAAEVTQATRIERMLTGEAAFLIAFLLASMGGIYWLYVRDERRTRGIAAFFASVTHELRTPLTSIRLQAESIADLSDAKAETAPLITRLLEDASRLESQVDRTLELARVEGGGVVYPQPIRLGPWLERWISRWASSYGDRVAIENRVEDVSLVADPGSLDVVLRNLFENAMKHSGREKTRVRISTELAPGWVTLRIEDDGQGSRLSGRGTRLGELFQKGPQSSGAGVGLYLVRVLTERMGGRSELGRASAISPSGAGFAAFLSFHEASNSSGNSSGRRPA